MIVVMYSEMDVLDCRYVDLRGDGSMHNGGNFLLTSSDVIIREQFVPTPRSYFSRHDSRLDLPQCRALTLCLL